MHKSAYEVGAKFLERYWTYEMESILEVGSFDVNGSIKDFKPQNCEWVGVDLYPGQGVDIVIERASILPFEDNCFDLVVATSVFEHDPTFWLTFNEMLRVVKPSGFVYVCAPSNGLIHRYPMDIYRFYPDAGIGLVEWGRRENSELQLVESFISDRDGDVWNDFCAVFSKTKLNHFKKIYPDTPCSNVWSDGVFLDNTFLETTEDMRIIENLKEDLASTNAYVEVNSRLRHLENITVSMLAELSEKKHQLAQANNQLDDSIRKNVSISYELFLMKGSISWRITGPLRNLRSWIKR